MFYGYTAAKGRWQRSKGLANNPVEKKKKKKKAIHTW